MHTKLTTLFNIKKLLDLMLVLLKSFFDYILVLLTNVLQYQ